MTFVALAKMFMLKLSKLFFRFRGKDEIFIDGTIEAVLSAYAVQIKLKYECLPPSKFGKERPLWETAMTWFLKLVKKMGPKLSTLCSSLNFHSWSSLSRVLTRLR